MENSHNYSWLATPIHKNVLKHLKFNWIDNPTILETLMMSFDGSIIAVLTSKVSNHLSNPDILRKRMGFEKMPKNFKIETEDEFYNYLAHHVEIAEE
jgi:hypothetical protein